MFTFNSDKDQGKQFAFVCVFAQCKGTLKVYSFAIAITETDGFNTFLRCNLHKNTRNIKVSRCNINRRRPVWIRPYFGIWCAYLRENLPQFIFVACTLLLIQKRYCSIYVVTGLVALKACSHGAIATAIYLLQLMGCVGVVDVATIAPCEHLHWILYNSLVAIRKMAVAIVPCGGALLALWFYLHPVRML